MVPLAGERASLGLVAYQRPSKRMTNRRCVARQSHFKFVGSPEGSAEVDENSLCYQVDSTRCHLFLRDVLKRHWGLSHALLTKLKSQYKIRVNGQVARTNYILQPGDLITVDLALDEINRIIPQDIPLEIVYEDADFLAINKPPGLAVHPDREHGRGSLANAVTHYLLQQGLHALFRPINRLDKGTSGLILIGKSQYAHQAVFRQQQQGMIQRCYQAVVEGFVKDSTSDIHLPIAHPDPASPRRVVHPDGQSALTSYQVAARYPAHTLLCVTLGTGRTHQIRVHLSHLGHPICGDPLYGSPSNLISRQALHAYRLSWIQPRTGKSLECQIPLPEDMIQLLAQVKPA